MDSLENQDDQAGQDDSPADEVEETSETDISVLKLDEEAERTLRKRAIVSVEYLIEERDDLTSIKGIGPKRAEEINNALKAYLKEE